MAKQIKKMNEGGSSTGFNARTGSKVVAKRTPTGTDSSYTNTTSGQTLNYTKNTRTDTTPGERLNYKKGGSVAATKKRK
jgi:hypothetical protein